MEKWDLLLMQSECELLHKVSFSTRHVKIGVSRMKSSYSGTLWQLTCRARKKLSGNFCLLQKQTEHSNSLTHKSPKHVCKTQLFNDGLYSHLWGSSPPALVSYAEAAQALSLGHLVLPRALVLSTGHRGRSFLFQLRQMLHAAVHLQGDTVGSIVIWTVSGYLQLWEGTAGEWELQLFVCLL